MKTNLLLYLFLLSFFSASAIKDPIRFGKIELSDLKMTAYEKDTSAAAVVLCDFGYFDASELEFKRIVRIKILKKEGYVWADKVFATSAKADIRGITYNLVDGEIEKTKLSNKSIFSDRITEKYYNMRVAMPNVKVGSVIDIEFRQFLIPNEWEFQKSIPVIHSELIIESSEFLSYKKSSFGYEPLSLSVDGHWIAKDMPAFKAEPFINSSKNYITKLEFNINSISIPGEYYLSIHSWKDISKILYKSEDFGLVIKASRYLSPLADKIKSLELSNIDMIKAAFNEIKTIKWNKEDRLYTSKPNLKKVYEEKIGNSADINIALLQLLRLLDFKANPVVLSTRDNGILSPTGPNMNKLNHVIICVKLENEDLLLDASEEYLPFNILPKKCFNMGGELIAPTFVKSIPLKATKKDKQFTSYNVKIDENLNLTGQLQCCKSDYAAFNLRKYIHSFNSEEEFLNDLTSRNSGLKIKKSELNNIDELNLPVTEKYEVKIANQITQIGDEYYINPMLCEQIKENPFKMNERKYPISFPYQKVKTVLINFALPEGFELVELPKPVKMKLPNNNGAFVYYISNNNNTINLKFSYSINKELFLPAEYSSLKEFYNLIIAKQAQPIILKKSHETKI
ncbi:DUF3858 domain-containing protein [Labilibaculum sp.]|uniref:DUF3858 domain-containing protein n=1 Tax=Labilibaculum sp. TaxID=2060723 RepID=UPI003567A6B3